MKNWILSVLFIFASHGFSFELKAKLAELVDNYKSKEGCSLTVISARDGKTIYEHNAHELFHSSSINKLFVAAAALKILGPHYCFKTEIFSNEMPSSGCLKSDLVLKGSGDPSFYDRDLEELMLHLQLAAVDKIEGDIILDPSEFDDLEQSPGWMWTDQKKRSSIGINGLLINEGKVDVCLQPSSLLGECAQLKMIPLLEEYTLNAQVLTEKIFPYQSKIAVEWSESAKTVKVKGVVSNKNPLVKIPVFMKGGAEYFASRLSSCLSKYQIQHLGSILVKETGVLRYSLGAHCSEPLLYLIQKMVKNDRALYANALLKKLGRAKYGKPGTWPSGSQTVREFLKTKVHDLVEEVMIVDGAGDSCYNKVSAAVVCEFLYKMHARFKFAPEFLASLSLAGIDGSLKKRFKDRRLYGSVRGVLSDYEQKAVFCGYLEGAHGSTYAFCLCTNEKNRVDDKHQRAFEDGLCEVLYKHGLVER